jgi:hypothetical protein
VKSAFSIGWDHPDEESWEGGDRGMFQIFTTLQFFRFDCYGMEDEDTDRLIEIAKGLGALCTILKSGNGMTVDK